MSLSRPDLSKLRARAGDPVTERKWNGLLSLIERLLDALRSMQGRGLHVDMDTGGIHLWAESDAVAFRGAFSVSRTGDGIQVGQGTVNGDLIPRISGRRIDGSDSRGEIPTLRLRDARPNADLRSWIVLQATPTPDSDPPALDPEDTGALVILHTDDLSASPEGTLWQPLAILVWQDESSLRTLHQIVYFHQRWKGERNEETGRVSQRMGAAA